MSPRITAKKKEAWISRLNNLKSTYLNVYAEVRACLDSDDSIEHLSNLTCEFDEAMNDIEDLQVCP
jgi:hypothetical protein